MGKEKATKKKSRIDGNEHFTQNRREDKRRRSKGSIQSSRAAGTFLIVLRLQKSLKILFMHCSVLQAVMKR